MIVARRLAQNHLASFAACVRLQSTSVPDFSMSTPKAQIYTRTGDKGRTSLFTGQRVSKGEPYFDALGDIDELNCHLGMARELLIQGAPAHVEDSTKEALLQQWQTLQQCLLDAGSTVATPLAFATEKQKERTVFQQEHINSLETWIDGWDATLEPLKTFILPGGGLVAAQLHICRAVCRRAERGIVKLRVEKPDVGIDIAVQQFLNRLSDYLFTLARVCTVPEGQVVRKQREAAKTE
eukprot:TRINITY_DN55345_c0_g1_i1.p1 TRINITY_DN55345_c0_g1~~TRINITY_DN55345_c0_g1_i1.p1  ORF type:complete len:247 (-),score=9.26 TRINITY_DN55345_c0_g1_i1:708-1421(-)